MAIKQLTLNQTVKLIKEIAQSHDQIKSVYFGDVWEFLAQPDNVYPAMFYSLTGSSISGKNLAMDFSLFFLDRQLQDETNETDVLSDQLLIGQDIFAMMSYPKFDWDISQDVTIDFFTENENDYLAGVKLDITVNYPMINDRCQVPSSFSYPEFLQSVTGTNGTVNYVKFLIDYPTFADLPADGDVGKIYVTNDTNRLYRFVDDAWIEIYPGFSWGGITGTLSAQTDLQNALNAKQNTITAGTTAQYWRGDKTWQTLPIYTLESLGAQAALGYTPYNATNPNGYISGINSSDVTTALGFTPYSSANPSNYITKAGLSAGIGISYNSSTGEISSTITQYNDSNARASITLTTNGTSGVATYNSTTGVLNIPSYAGGGGGSINWGAIGGTLSAQTDLQSALDAKQNSLGFTPYNATNPAGYTSNTGTVTSVAALTLGTSGTDLSSSVSNGSTSAVITLNVPTASSSNRGVLSSSDWTTFNNKQGALTLTTTGTSGAATLVGNTLNIPQYSGGGGGSTSPGGSNTQIQFNNSGAFGGSANLTWDGTSITATNQIATGGSASYGAFTPTFTDGIVSDYVSGYGRISVGGGDGIQFFNGGVGGSLLGQVTSGGDWDFNGNLIIGTGTVITGAVNPILAIAASSAGYVQAYIHNDSNGTSSSSDIACYPDNGIDSSGWIDMGITSSTYSDASYTTTGANEGYIFMSAPSGASKSGNLVFATDSTGTQNYFQWYVGGFGQAKSAFKMQLKSTALDLSIPLNSTVATGTAPFTVASTTQVANLFASKAATVSDGSIGIASHSATGTPSSTTYLRGDNTWATLPAGNVGTVTSIAALTLTTTGTDLSSSVANGTSTPVITLNVPTASATNRGVLSSTDWSTFNGKQAALNGTGFVKSTAGVISYDTNTYLTANQSITLSGAVTGTGSTAITTTLASSVVGISNLSATGTPSSTTYLRGDNTWATISGGGFTGVLPAGTATTAPLDFTTSGAVMKTSSVAGDMEVDSDGILYYSHADVSEGVIHAEQFIAASGTRTLTSQTAAQKIFGTPTNGAVTVKAATTYYFECFYSLTSMSATSGSFGFAIGGTATFTSLNWTSMAVKATTGTTAATLQTTFNSTAANTTIVTASTQTGGSARITGTIRVNAAGTIIPQVSLGQAAAAVVGANSYFRIIPIGTNTVTSVGNWS